MLGAIKDEDLARHGLGRDHVRVLRHVPRAVDLARVVDPLHDVDARLARGERVSAELAPLVVVRAAVEHVRTWPGPRRDLHRRDLQVVRCLAGRVRAEQQAVRRVGFVCGAVGVGCTPVIGRGGPKEERDMGHTFLCPGTIGKSGSANRVHELSSDRTDMGHSSSCRDMYMTPLTRATVSLPYLVLLRGNSTTVWLLCFVRDTHLVDELVLLLGILKFIFYNCRFHVPQAVGRYVDGKSKGQGTRRASSAHHG